MTHTVSGGTLNSAHSLTWWLRHCTRDCEVLGSVPGLFAASLCKQYSLILTTWLWYPASGKVN